MGYKPGTKKLYVADLESIVEDNERYYLVKIGTWGEKEALNRFYGTSADPYYKQRFPNIKIAASLVGKEKDVFDLEKELLEETKDCYFNMRQEFSGYTEIRKLNPLQRKELLQKVYESKDKVRFY